MRSDKRALGTNHPFGCAHQRLLTGQSVKSGRPTKSPKDGRRASVVRPCALWRWEPSHRRANAAHRLCAASAVSRKKRGSHRRKQAVRRLAKARAHQARKRLDFLHKETCQLACENALVAMEELAIKNMTRSAKGTVDKPGKNVPQKTGLNREILDTAPALLMQLRRYKVTDTGRMWAEAPTRKLKPSQTCPECGHVRKKSLSERTHRCESCGHTEPRDRASARVVLNWALYGTPTAPQSRQELTAAGFVPCKTPSNRSATWLE